jgi:toxin ParE1/3/4
MNLKKFELTVPAEEDVRRILGSTLALFGSNQVELYGQIIERGMLLVADNPHRPGSSDRSEIGAGVRMFHLQRAARRRGAAAHCLYYKPSVLAHGQIGVIILRVLHEHMEPRRQIARALLDSSNS